ncbi:hypothetical protein BKH42_04935 [Helicobacter sp. 13S00482-2]|uniref:AAC(3) family N-acetyltransferase n=1 Tax=Helicobacter sp. 13S00482-2 TaxID=1476200 RepID=UPI000BA5C011|nr:AAC(3) family N-acetyltransferase [Helicobacter sp. 13S00482-2]PAF53668.1 hypothetical protein BKH42_04935 [Helicobacter sp. 13S00482-2]
MQDLNTVLFIDKNNPITKNDILKTLIELGAKECDYLFIHSELNFGAPNEKLNKRELLGHIVDIFTSMKIKNIIMPTFSFSFCAKEDFDIKNTKSPMGILSEYFRKLQSVERTLDPLMSCAVMGEDRNLFNISKQSCGVGSLFDKLHNKDVKFLFFGNRVCDCFTYSHYIERMLEVPYRYDKIFGGKIILENTNYEDSFVLPVRYANVEAFKDDTLNRTLNKYNAIKEMKIGQSQIQIIDERNAYKIISEEILSNIDFMLEFPYPRDFLDKSYIYEKKVAL